MKTLSFSILRLRAFRLLLATRSLTTMALVAQAVIVGWQVYALTGDPFLLGLIGLTEAVPAIACALFAGHIVDSSRPHKIYVLCVLALVLNTALLALAGGGFFGLSPAHLLYVLFAGVFASGMARSFLVPASFSLVSQIVPRSDMPSASSWLTGGFQVAAIGGPAVAGLIYGGYGPGGAWLVPGLSVALALLCLLFLKIPHAPRGQKREPAARSIIEGWRFILHNRILLWVMAIDMFAVLFGGAVALLPAFADQILQAGPEGLGALRAAPALGAIVVALAFAVRPMKIISTARLILAVAGFGLCMIGFGLSGHFWLSMGFLALSGAFDSVSMIIRATLMQLLTPEPMRGRVSAVGSMFIISSNEIGAFESGLAARLLGLVPSVVLGGIGTLMVAGTAAASKTFRRMRVEAGETAA